MGRRLGPRPDPAADPSRPVSRCPAWPGAGRRWPWSRRPASCARASAAGGGRCWHRSSWPPDLAPTSLGPGARPWPGADRSARSSPACWRASAASRRLTRRARPRTPRPCPRVRRFLALAAPRAASLDTCALACRRCRAWCTCSGPGGPATAGPRSRPRRARRAPCDLGLLDELALRQRQRGEGGTIHRAGSTRACALRTPVRTVLPVGFNNPAMPWKELERRLSNGRAPGSPSWNAGGDGPAWSRKRQPFEPAAAAERRRGSVPYAELHCHSNFSFLDGASHPEELAEEAARLGLEALALTDHDGLYGVVRFAEAARAVGLPTVFGAELTLGRRRGPRTAWPTRWATTWSSWPTGPDGLRPPGPRHQPGPAGRGEGRAPVHPRRAGRRRAGALVGAHRLPQGHGARRPRGARPGRRRAGSCDGWSRPSAGTGSPSSCGTTGTRWTRPATTPWPSWPPATTWPASPPATSTTPPRPTGPSPPRWPRCGPGAAWTSSTPGCRPPAAPTCARGRRWPAASPATPAWWSGRPRSGGPRPSTSPWWRRPSRRSPAPTGYTEMSYLRELVEEGATAPLRPPGTSTLAWAGPSTTSWRSSRASGFPGYFLVVWDIVEFCRRERHLLPGAGERGQQRGLLRARRHQGRRRVARPAVRALPVARARRSARHRPGHRVRPPGGGHPARLRGARPPPHRPGGQRHHLPGPLGRAGHGQGPRLRRRAAGRLEQAGRRLGAGGGHGGPAGAGSSAAAGPPDHDIPADVLALAKEVEDYPRHLGIHSGGMVICDRPVIEVCPVEWARMENRSVLQWDKDDCAAVGLVKFDLLGPGDALGPPPRRRPDPRPPGLRGRPGHHPPGARGLRDAVPGRLHRRVPGGVPGPDGHPAPAATADVLRPGGGGGPDPPRAHPGRVGPPLHPPPQRPGGGDLPAPPARSTAWRRPWGCRCSRSSSCRWPSTWPASPPPRPTSCARPWAPSAAGCGWSACGPGSTPAWPSGASRARWPTRSSSRCRPSPTTASRRATASRSPTWSTPRPGSSCTSRRRSAPPC